MTEEKKIICKQFLDDADKTHSCNEYKLLMALLEHTSTTKNDLGVDADKLIADCEKMSFDFELFGRPTKALLLDAVKNIVKKLPSVTPQEPRKGHWIGHREHCENLGVMPSGLGAYEWCSNCDCGIDVREWHRNHYNFCPNCGAKMVEPQESGG